MKIDIYKDAWIINESLNDRQHLLIEVLCRSAGLSMGRSFNSLRDRHDKLSYPFVGRSIYGDRDEITHICIISGKRMPISYKKAVRLLKEACNNIK